MTCIGNVYSKNLLVRLTNSKSEDRFKTIHITVDYQTSTMPTHKTELIIKLTDEQDPFFLYSLYMSEEDYQTLKVQQGLLVDFGAFGQRFIDLLCACEKDEKAENPKFQLQFYSKEPLPFDHGHANLNVIEINPFKHLCHLSLSFMPGNDTDVKKYLATCLQSLREDYTKLNRLYEENRSNSAQKLEQAQQTISQKTMEIEKMKVDLDSLSERLITKHMQELNFERDKSIQTQYATQQKYEKEKKDLEANLLKTIKQLEQRTAELELTNKDLLEKRYKNESQLQELRVKNSTLQDEFNACKLELTNLRKENSTLDAELHTNEKLGNQMKTRIAVLEQELKDKIEQINKSQELLNTEQSQRKHLDELVKEKSNELKKKQAEINHYVQEFKKGNEVVLKLQTREKTLSGQIKLKTKILTEQEKVMKEKEKEIDDLKAELKDQKAQMTLLSDENRDLKASLQKKSNELDEAAKLLKRDENIISWLNKQINDNNINKMTTSNTNGISSDGVVFKPLGALVNLNGGLGAGNLSSTSPSSNHLMTGIDSTALGTSNLLRLNSTSNTTAANQYLNGKSTTTNFIGSSNYQPSKNLLTSSSSSSIPSDLVKENQEIESSALSHRVGILNGINSATNGATATTANGSASSRLDPKYFQSHSPTAGLETSLKSQLANKVPNLATTATSNASARINKHLVQQNTLSSVQTQPTLTNNQYAIIPSKSTPSLASAYFPTTAN